jgi:hypothetical protein
MRVPDKVLFVHQGALGDFLLAWPALWAVAGWARGGMEAERGMEKGEGIGGGTFCSGKTLRSGEYEKKPFLLSAYEQKVPPPNPLLPKTLLRFVGDKQRMIWLEPLGVRFREPETAREIDRLYGREKWPESLEDTLLVWPGLQKRPPVPEHDNVWFLPGFARGRRVSPRDLYLEELQGRGVPVHGDYVQAFRALFAAGREPGRTVLLFPGAGHPRKAWPLVKYLELAARLSAAGLEPLFVLGPAEVEQGMDVPGTACVRPESLAALQALILRAAAVVGGDTGPLHLAAMLGVPMLSLFGPTDPAVWAPYGARILAAADACAPCAGLAADIDCGHGRCLTELAVDAVWAALVETYAG